MLRVTGLILTVVLVQFVGSSTLAISESMYPSAPISIADATEYLNKAHKISPENVELLYAKAVLEMLLAQDLGSVDGPEARQSLLEAAAGDLGTTKNHAGETSDYHYLMAVLSIESTVDIQAAAAHLEKALEGSRDTDRVMEQLAILYQAEKRYSDCIELLSPRAASTSSPQLHQLLAVAYLYVEDHSAAEESAKRSVALGGGQQSRLVLASAQSLSGKFSDAESNLRTVLESDAGNRTALVGLTNVLLKSGQLDEAKQISTELGRRYPDDAEIQSYLSGLDWSATSSQ